MSLTPTEREEHFFKAMVDAADGSTPEELEPTERKEHWYKEIIDAIKSGGGGSGGGVLVVTNTDGTLDKTWQEIYDAAENGIPTALRVAEGDNITFNWLSSVSKEGDAFYVDFGSEGVNFEEFITDSASGYPTNAQ